VAWALVAGVAFGVTQTLNRKSNQLIGPYRTAFGLIVVVEVALLTISFISGEIGRLAGAPWGALVAFAVATSFHFGAGWTLVAMSQQRVGVARTGAVVSAAPLVGAIAAALVLDEPLTPFTAGGVLLVVTGVVVISLSTRGRADPTAGEPPVWRGAGWPWHALAVAALWGTTPILIRRGLEDLPSPILGLTVGLAATVVVYGVGLTVAGAWDRRIPTRAIAWTFLGGLTGAVAITTQWISFDLTTVAISLSLQQTAVLVVVALAPIMFPEPIERINRMLLIGTVAILAGTMLVVYPEW
jgi:drug/metabolite transporter (DMT)-like permease